jgi:hypothetical protein
LFLADRRFLTADICGPRHYPSQGDACSDRRADRTGHPLFVAVSQLSDIASKLWGERLIMPRRTTFYGSTEVGYADPAGNIVVFAEHPATTGS